MTVSLVAALNEVICISVCEREEIKEGTNSFKGVINQKHWEALMLWDHI